MSDPDLNLLAACILLGLLFEDTEERAGILEFDAGLSRDEADLGALFLAMRRRDRRYTWRFVNEFFDVAGPALEMERANGWTRKETAAWIGRLMRTAPNAKPVPAESRTVV